MQGQVKKAQTSHDILKKYVDLHDYAHEEISNILREYDINDFDMNVLRGLLDDQNRIMTYLLSKSDELRR